MHIYACSLTKQYIYLIIIAAHLKVLHTLIQTLFQNEWLGPVPTIIMCSNNVYENVVNQFLYPAINIEKSDFLPAHVK